jgi:hypothetical protein
MDATRKDIKSFQTNKSKSICAVYDYPEHVDGSFVGKLKCQNLKCNEITIFAGEISADITERLTSRETGMETVIEEVILPKYFNPAMEVFHLKKVIPKPLKIIITNSFGLYWGDSSACANKIRIAVEFILDEKGVQKYNRTGRRIPFSLNRRINLFKVKNPDVASLFEAIRWIGNAGSHVDDSLTKDDLIPAFEILESSLDLIYDHRPKAIAAMAKKIIKSKGPIKKKRKKR